MRYEVWLREVNQSEHTRTTNVNGEKLRRRRRGVYAYGEGFEHFVPWSNVAYIRKNGR